MHLTHPTPRRVILTLDPTLDARHSHSYRDLVSQAFADKPDLLDIDLTQLTFIDSTGLGLLVLTRNEAEPLGCAVRLMNLTHPHPKQVMELMKFDHLFAIHYGGDAA